MILRQEGKARKIGAAGRLSLCFQQNDEGTSAALGSACLAKGHHFFLLHQPAAHLVLQYRLLVDGAKSLAVNDANATHAALDRIAQELGQRFARFLAPHAMQVELPLDHPVAASQLAQGICTDADAGVAEFLIGVEQGIDVELVGQGFFECRLLVRHALMRNRQGTRQGRNCFAGRRQWRDLADAAAEQIGIAPAFLFAAQAFSLRSLARFFLRLDFRPNFLESGEVLDGARHDVLPDAVRRHR